MHGHVHHRHSAIAHLGESSDLVPSTPLIQKVIALLTQSRREERMSGPRGRVDGDPISIRQQRPWIEKLDGVAT
jgi:hypothetical protein